jgi:threonine dehydrogenase-like Zn-dependent dehydrogenase
VRMKLIGGQIPGGMADCVVVPIENLIRAPDNVPAVLRVLVEPLAVGVHAANRAPSLKGADCLVQGCGPIGLLVAFVLRTHNPARVSVLEVDRRRLDIASHFGFEVLSSAEESDEPFDVVFEGSGKSLVCQAASWR